MLIAVFWLVAGVATSAQVFTSLGIATGPNNLGFSGTQIPAADYTIVPNAEMYSGGNDDSTPLVFSGVFTLGYHFNPLSVYARVGYAGRNSSQTTGGSSSQSYTTGTYTSRDHLDLLLRQLVTTLHASYELGADVAGEQFSAFGGLGAGVSIQMDNSKIVYREANGNWPSYTEGTPSSGYDDAATLPVTGLNSVSLITVPELGVRWYAASGKHGFSLGAGANVYLTPRVSTVAVQIQDEGGNAALVTAAEKSFELYFFFDYSLIF
ncbi:hypothetical protein L21SP2_1523 [Salinispira pacifica]|uniref:Uncharacterized protein n=2 Tax=Salinispira pacifica TaxID=1307761 RepID=V5WGK6_9SPIO|nr:hypothetical protein L21SP2_1523 [Salinispira pacifica]